MMYKMLFISACSITLFSCSQDFPFLQSEEEEEVVEAGYLNVEQDLWSHFEAFEEEAAKRGISIDLNRHNLVAEIDEIHERGVAGTCQYGRNIANHVTIDKSFWNRSGYSSREFVVFHELGHCVLNRGHDESIDSKGRCLSLMRSGTKGCIDAYGAVNRNYYLNELFESNL